MDSGVAAQARIKQTAAEKSNTFDVLRLRIMNLLDCDGPSSRSQIARGCRKNPVGLRNGYDEIGAVANPALALACEGLRVFGDEVRDVIDDGVRQAAGIAQESASVGLEFQASLALGAGDDVQQFRVERHGGVYTRRRGRTPG